MMGHSTSQKSCFRDLRDTVTAWAHFKCGAPPCTKASGYGDRLLAFPTRSLCLPLQSLSFCLILLLQEVWGLRASMSPGSPPGLGISFISKGTLTLTGAAVPAHSTLQESLNDRLSWTLTITFLCFTGLKCRKESEKLLLPCVDLLIPEGIDFKITS